MSEFASEIIELVGRLGRDQQEREPGTLSAGWPQIQELGLVGIGRSEQSGGSGGEFGDLLVVIAELSRVGIDTPIVEAAIAACALGTPPDPAHFDTVVVAPRLDLAGPALSADLPVVPFAPLAQRLVVIGADRVIAVDLDAATIDPVLELSGLPSGRVQVSAAPVTACPGIDPAWLSERLAAARSAALLGSARGAYELTRDYVGQRRQFGAPLIEIPAVAAQLAQMAVRIEIAETALRRVAAVDDAATPLGRFSAVAAARIAAAQVATLVARTTHQLHGAVGITREYGLHRYTTALWSQRDADSTEYDWAHRLGSAALASGEDVLWHELTG